MRLTSIHVANALTFDDITVPLETEGPTVFVGPNGSGKTNLFRVVEQLLKILPEGMGPHTNGLTDSLSTLAGWQRDLGSPTVLEVGIQWTEDEEISLFATFIGLSLSDHHPFSRELNIPTGFEQRPTWERFTGTLANMVKVQSATFLATGVLGLRYQAPGSFHLYYQMLAGESLTWILPPQGSDVTLTVPDDLLRSQRTHSVALSQMWLRSLPDEERARLGSFLDQGDDTTPVPQLSFSLSDALQQAVLDTGQSPVPARAMVRVAIDSSFRGQEAVRSLERQVLSGQDQTGRNMTLTDVLCYLLSGRIVVSDDLLSAPEEQYTINTWLRDAKPLSSRHLGAYLADLKDGNDADRRRFAEIQRTFADLSRGRDLDVTRIRPRDTSEEVVIRVVQRAHGDRLSTPVVTSGSGLVELAYLATILNLPRCHVALLDEPGRSLHPQALLALRHHLYHQRKSGDTDSSSQSVVITHSPYLVPTTAPPGLSR